MTLSAYKELLSERWRVLKINLVNSYQVETAYFVNNWASILSALMYTVTYLLFINIIYSNVTTMAGYTRNDMLFFSFVSQLNFWLLVTFSLDNNEALVEDVNRGTLDLILVKPLPTLFYISLRHINIVGFLREGGIQSLIIIWTINWETLNISASSITLGMVAMAFGIIAADMVKFLLSIPVFWKGEAQELSALFYPLISQDLPWEGLNVPLRLFFSTLVPVLISTSLTVSIMLQKAPLYPMVGLAVTVGIVSLLVKSYFWKKALRNYSSASS